MADDQLRMQAVVVDKATGPLKEIQRSLRDIAKSGNFSSLRGEFEGLRRATELVGREIKSVMVPAFGALGLSSASVVASIIGITKALKGFSGGALDLHHLGRETLVATAQLRAFENAAERMRIAPEAAQQGIRTFTEHLTELKNMMPGLRDELAHVGAQGLSSDLTELAKQGRNFEAVKRGILGIQEVARKKGVGEARFLSQLLFGNPEMWRVTLGLLQESENKFRNFTVPDPKKAQAFEDAIIDLGEAFRDLKIALGNDLLPTFTELTKQLTDFVEGPAGKEMAAKIRSIGDSLKDIDWKGVEQGVRGAGGAFIDLGKGVGSLIQLWKDAPPEVREGLLGALIGARLGGVKGAVVGGGLGIADAERQRLRDAGNPAATATEGAANTRRTLSARNRELSQVEKELAQTDREGAAYKRLSERREALVREIHDLDEGLKALQQAIDAAAKKMNFMAPAGGGPIIVPASLTTGGGGVGNFRPGFRGSGAGASLQQGLGGGGGAGGGGGPSGGGGVSGSAGLPAAAASPPQRFATAVPGVSGSAGMPGGRNLDGSGRLHDLTSVPTPVLDQAKALLQRGGSTGALQQFMAAQGYPKSGNWCGEFAASVVSASGGQPPKGAAVASNWMNWGEHVDAENAKAGDIAVRKRSRFGGMSRPGQTGSHVGLVDSVDSRSGRFNLLGGNQGRPIVPHGLNEYEFRRGRSNIDNALRSQLNPAQEGSARITVDVNAPKGTKVGAEADGLFRDVQMNRSTQMTPAQRGPAESFGTSGAP